MSEKTDYGKLMKDAADTQARDGLHQKALGDSSSSAFIDTGDTEPVVTVYIGNTEPEPDPTADQVRILLSHLNAAREICRQFTENRPADVSPFLPSIHRADEAVNLAEAYLDALRAHCEQRARLVFRVPAENWGSIPQPTPLKDIQEVQRRTRQMGRDWHKV